MSALQAEAVALRVQAQTEQALYHAACESCHTDLASFAQYHLEGWPISDNMVRCASERVERANKSRDRYRTAHREWWVIFNAACDAESERLGL